MSSVAVVIILMFGVDGRADPSSTINFSAQILPILSRNCFACHGPDAESRQANLRLDQKPDALRSDPPVIIPGDPHKSSLVHRITSHDPETRMPPADSKRQLTEAEKELLIRWIQEGADWTEHWSFLPVRRPEIPVVDETAWARDPIDQFIQKLQESRHVVHSQEAAFETLLRRASLDLIGLPPTLDELREVIADDRPDAYERFIDRLMASPRYGERWGRHWLDVARYADSGGFEEDAPRIVWKYRDWVIAAINRDLPFDEFVVDQIAGDLLPDASNDERIATGFLLNSQQDGGSEPSRLDAVVDRVNTIGSVFLGLTLGCAQCHAHKFDPITQTEFYGLFAFLNAADEHKLEFASPEQITRRNALQAQVDTLIAERTAYSSRIPSDVVKSDPGYLERSATIDELKRRIPVFDSALVLQSSNPARPTTSYIRGDFSRPGPVVEPGVPGVLPTLPDGPRTRLALARWLTRPEQPLTSRVVVNRSWQQFFGRGLVETENDFGVQGRRPSHPELLDWLAAEFSESGWQWKQLHRRIVETATYRQCSHRNPQLDEIDPENHLLARQSRLRLEAEAVRDSALAVGGLLSSKMEGPSVFPFQHEGVLINRATPANWTTSPGEDRYRRSLYTWYWRLTPHPQLQTFDAPDAIVSCTRRNHSNTPLQALTILNDPMFDEAAGALAAELLGQSEPSDDKRLTDMFERCFARRPTDAERHMLNELLVSVRSRVPSNGPDSTQRPDDQDRIIWRQVARTMINLEEFIMRE